MLTESQEKDFETVEHRLRDGIVKYDEVEALSRLRAALEESGRLIEACLKTWGRWL